MLKVILLMCLISVQVYATTKLGFNVDEKSKVISFYEVESGSPIIPEFLGDLVLEEDKIFYFEKNHDFLQIGAMKEGGEVKLCLDEFASVCSAAIGAKIIHGEEPIYSINLSFQGQSSEYRSNKELLDYLMPSPNPGEIENSLYFAVSGAVEILINKNFGKKTSDADLNGDTNLSPRFLMSISHDYEDQIGRKLTNLVYTYNLAKGSFLNRDYPFTKGYYKNDKGDMIFGTGYNFIDSSIKLSNKLFLSIEPLDRTILFENTNPSSVAVIKDRDVLQRIKEEIKKGAPVVVNYNHFGKPHAALIVGFDDDKESLGCGIVSQSIRVMSESKNPMLASLTKSTEDLNGCLEKGVFFVKDAIYEGDEKVYDYTDKYVGEEEHYSARVVERPYDWVTYLSNNVYSVHFIRE